jgi:hypothetical protein
VRIWEHRGGRMASPLLSRRAHLLTTTSSQTPYPSPCRKRQVSLIPLLLLSPQSFQLCGDPLRRWYGLRPSCAHLRAKSRASPGCAPKRLAAARCARRMRLLRKPPGNATSRHCLCQRQGDSLLGVPCYWPAKTCHWRLFTEMGETPAHALFCEREPENRTKGR